MGVRVGTGDGVDAGVDVGGTDVGVGVLVACISPGVSVGGVVGVAVGPSPHADSNAAASNKRSPTHAVRRMDSPNTPLTPEVNANCLSLLLGLAAKSINPCWPFYVQRIYLNKLNFSVNVLDSVQFGRDDLPSQFLPDYFKLRMYKPQSTEEMRVAAW